MMVYKYWDSITKEDLEFSVGSKQAVWEVDYAPDQKLLMEDGSGGGQPGGYGAYGAVGGQPQPGYPPVPPTWGGAY